jgi:hypothetical protein
VTAGSDIYCHPRARGFEPHDLIFVSKKESNPIGLLFFLCCTANLDATAKKSIESKAFVDWRQFYVQPKQMPAEHIK